MKYLVGLASCVVLSSLVLAIMAESSSEVPSDSSTGMRTKRSDPVLPGLLLGGTGLLLGLGIGHHLKGGHGHRGGHHGWVPVKVVRHYHHQGWGWHEPVHHQESHGWGWSQPSYGHGWGWHK